VSVRTCSVASFMSSPSLAVAHDCCLFRTVQADDLPTSEVIALLRTTMRRSRSSKFILQGFPRNAEESAEFESAFGQPSLWIHLDHPKARVPVHRSTVRSSSVCEATLLMCLVLWRDVVCAGAPSFGTAAGVPAVQRGGSILPRQCWQR
jgi:hypothetical protein